MKKISHIRKVAGYASAVAIMVCTSQAVRADNPTIILDPPQLDYAAICEPRQIEESIVLDRDWTNWDGMDLGVDALTAIKVSHLYLRGRGEVARSPETARRILEVAMETYPGRRSVFLLPMARTLQAAARTSDDFHQAESLLLESYDSGSTRAALALGQFYGEDGPAEMRNAEQARRFLRISALSADPQGLLEYAQVLVVDPNTPIEQKRTAVLGALLNMVGQLKEGDCSVLNTIGFLYLRGVLVQQDINVALKWLEAYAQTGDPRTANYLANLFISNQVEQIDVPKSIDYLRQAASGGIASAQFGLGKAYVAGLSVERDLDLAKDYFLQASKQGLLAADEWLARIYSGEFGGLADETKAKEYFEKALKQPERSETLRLVYGEFLSEIGNKEDLQHALDILQQAADAGSVDAANQIAKIYLQLGRENTKLLEKSLEYFRTSAKSGNSDGASMLAKMFSCGMGVPISVDLANKWLHQSAVLGGVNSIYITGLNLLASENERDRERGRVYIKQAAFKGSPAAIGYAVARWEKGVEGFKEQPYAAERLSMFVDNLKDPVQRTRAKISILRNRFEVATTVEEKEAQIRELEPLLKNGGPEAYLAKAEMLRNAGTANDTELVDIYRVVAEMGDIRGQRELGKHLLSDLTQDVSVGRGWLEKASASGDFKAKLALLDPGASDVMGQMAEISVSGEVCTVDEMVTVARVYSTLPDPQASTMAKYWMSLATTIADRDADDLYAIGSALQDGVDGVDHRFRAEEYLLGALALGRNSVLRDLAEGHLNGLWQEASADQAKDYLRKLADLGDKEAGNKLLSEIADGTFISDVGEVSSLLLFLGDEVKSPGKYMLKLARLNLAGSLGGSDSSKVIEWLTLSAQDGEPNSMYRLYQAYFFGDGTEKDIPLALEWLTKSGEAGNVKAARDLAAAFKVGVPGLSPDAEQAAYWQKQFEELSDLE
ncbi:Sel1 repeat [Roseibium album]|nr:Sel1 repeat [Roseibium album]